MSRPAATSAHFPGQKAFRPPWRHNTLSSQLTLALLIAICLKVMLRNVEHTSLSNLWDASLNSIFCPNVRTYLENSLFFI